MAISEPRAARALGPEVIRVSSVSKRFVMRQDNSLKERLVTLGVAGRKHREDFWALRDVTLSIRAGSTVGLIGHNGSGKSTLLKVIGGIVQPSRGGVEQRGRIAALLELGAGFHPDLTGRENVFLNAAILGLSREETESRFDDILAFAGIGDFINTQVKFYSSGMYVRLAFAVAIHSDPDILLVDEVLAVGDEAFQRKCLDKIMEFQEEGRTIVLVTHSMDQVREMCDYVILLDHGEVIHQGDPAEAIERFREMLEQPRQDSDQSTAPEDTKGPETIVGARVQSPGVSPGAVIPSGQDVVVTVDVAGVAEASNWVCAIELESTLGQIAFATSSEWSLGAPFEGTPDRFSIAFRLEQAALAAGRYAVNVSLIDALTFEHLDDAPQACVFDVVTPEPTRGVVRIATSVDVTAKG